MKSSSEIEEICKKYDIENYTINDDGSIDVNGSVFLEEIYLTKLPLDFNKVTGDFSCDENRLTTLKGSPKYVGGGFYCANNKLTSLKYCPERVGDIFNCNHNKLTSLEFSPKYVGSSFISSYNKIRDLYGISDHIGRFFMIMFDTPISSIINEPVDIDFIRAFNIYRVIKDDKVVLKRLKYVMELFDMSYDLEKIKEYYEII